jgi:hypothetical protein
MALGPFIPNYGFAQTTNGATRITQYFSSTTVVGFAPPANAVAFLLQAENVNPGNIRYGVGVAAGITAGHQLEPGRDSGFIPFGGSTLTICVEVAGTTCLGHLTWFTNS